MTSVLKIQTRAKAEAKDDTADEAKDPGDKTAAEPGINTPSAPGKRFASFLSHFKRECGTEARLVQLQLKQILPGDNNDVFLDSGEAPQLTYSSMWHVTAFVLPLQMT